MNALCPLKPHLFNSIDLIHFAYHRAESQHIILPKFLMASLPWDCSIPS